MNLTLLNEIRWESPNGKYFVKARLWDDHGTLMTDTIHGTYNKQGKSRIMPYRKLPMYVKDKVAELVEGVKQ